MFKNHALYNFIAFSQNFVPKYMFEMLKKWKFDMKVLCNVGKNQALELDCF